MQFCAEPQCGVLVQRGRCPAHAPRERAAERIDYARVHAWYRSKRWQALRRQVIDGQPFCSTCLRAGRRVLTVDVDHVLKHDGDPIKFWNLANLQGLCKRCHTRKTARGE